MSKTSESKTYFKTEELLGKIDLDTLVNDSIKFAAPVFFPR